MSSFHVGSCGPGSLGQASLFSLPAGSSDAIHSNMDTGETRRATKMEAILRLRLIRRERLYLA